MARLMCDLGNLEIAVRRKFKKVFERLNDDYVVRTPALDDSLVAPFVIEGPKHCWVLVGLHNVVPTGEELDQYLTLNKVLTERGWPALKYLAVCETGESLFDKKDASLSNVTVVERADFFTKGEYDILDALVNVAQDGHNWLKRTLVSESMIIPACTTRRGVTSRDTSAKLQSFFLDYDQELATKLDIWGDTPSSEQEDTFSVRLINGVAGCGKTLILVNRAILYCKKYPERKALLLIHNKPITYQIKYNFENYLGGQPGNLIICTFHSYALAQRRKLDSYVKALITDKQKKPFIDKVLNDSHEAYRELKLSDEQIWSELEYINEFLIEDKAHYLDYERQGRGFSLSKTQRSHIWELYLLSVKCMSSVRNGYLPSLYIRELCLSGEDIAFDEYDHVLIDETQFFFPSWLELVKKSIKLGGQLFLCADPNQGFLKSRLSWKSIGLNVRGRTKKLSYSYRTTYEIMVASNALLELLDEHSEDFIQPNLDKMERGSKPQIVYSANPQDEQTRFLNELSDCVSHHHIPLQQMIVLCSESISPWHLKRVIEDRLGKGTVVNCNDHEDLDNNLGDKIRVMSINSCTGMEAGIIFVLGVGSLLDKANSLDLNDEEKLVIQQETTRKLYVAMTRAGQKLVLFSTERLPSNVEALMEIA